MNLFFLIFGRTLVHAFRKGGGAFGTCGFYIIIITVFVFALGPEAMAHFAGAVMSVAMLLASVTALPLFYERDYEDGTLEQYLLQPIALELVTLAKILGQWCAVIVPILIISPVIALMANGNSAALFHALLLLLLASPTLVAIGSIASALTLGSRRGGLLQALIMLPLSIPVLIFAASPQGADGLFLLSGVLLVALPLSCLASAALIKISQD